MKRNIVVAGAMGLLLALGLFVSAGEAMARAVPPGSYLASCTRVEFRDFMLGAYCRTINGAWQPTRLNTLTCAPGSDISNRNGMLTCPVRPILQPPHGSYLRSCRNAVLGVAGVLRAQCQRINGSWVSATLNMRACQNYRDIANVNGRLYCN
ncbi:CVNH domain-containing protein [Xanthobacter sp. V3C-3]|uniref:CVNH domain-containing protein n=1 Tax=Xanthobacter lutulentifluminis TaxID=3119935 RepID=UPI00372BF351